MKKGTQLKKHGFYYRRTRSLCSYNISFVEKQKPLSSKNFTTTKYLIGAELLLNFGQ